MATGVGAAGSVTDPRDGDGGSVVVTVEMPAGVRVGHWTGDGTGVTVVLPPPGTTASGEVRGGAPATREFDLLAPERMVDRVDAVVLSGGSAFGLAAGDGVMRALRDRGEGFATAYGPVPIVVGMSIFDASVATTPPDAASGRAALLDALSAPVDVLRTGRVGAGTGATTGRWRGRQDPGGFGVASARDSSGAIVTAFAVVNALGSIITPDGRHLAPSDDPHPLTPPNGSTSSGTSTPNGSTPPAPSGVTGTSTPTPSPLTGNNTPAPTDATGTSAPTPSTLTRNTPAPTDATGTSAPTPSDSTGNGDTAPSGSAGGDAAAQIAAPSNGTTSPTAAPGDGPVWPFGGTARENTTIVVVATDAALTKTECLLLAQSGHDGMARALHPSHTRFDGDAVVALATGTTPATGEHGLDTIRATAIDVVAAAIRNAAV
ncbi:P1 family peptidase [Catenuloplanes atrovinosus]|uniref:L-aminopeptidase/D-esterase-like protein n=1 Tax=Catenuloplanes atrovinosus TaxID=137266 RepID=A0AAE4C8H3_9ACTN|nr:P1 family peptidase [Catenuloplanes atrovinosus]MDR7273794.1 L-aminopeptidase/D-esterase-like protein [Catenuloplanes atrovinosus]